MSNIEITSGNSFNAEAIQPQSVVLNYRTDTAILSYSKDNNGKKHIIRKSFLDIFTNINKEILSNNTNMLLPTGCIYSTKIKNGKEAFLMQEMPGVRTFRLTNKEAVTKLVAKMYNKFNAQTNVLEKNEVSDDLKEEVKKQIDLRNQYIQSQSNQLMTNIKDETYKLNFRVYFPYTYILIIIERLQNGRGIEETRMNNMKAAIALEPIKTFTDFLYQFPLSNVSFGGGVCTGKLSLGTYGMVNTKTYVEKMTGYFWNNRFNADITAGPETYGNINFLGNWFEWEFNSYVNPEKLFQLNFKDTTIDEKKRSVAKFIFDVDDYDRTPNRRKNESKIIRTIDAYSISDGFSGNIGNSDTLVDLENGIASKKDFGIADSIQLEGHEIKIGSLLKTKTDKKKKFKILSFDGIRKYDVDDSSIIEKESIITHIQLKDSNNYNHRIPLNEKSIKFLVSSFRKAKNYMESAKFGNIVFKIGDVIANEKIDYDMIKSIREKPSYYIFDFYNLETMFLEKTKEVTSIKKVDFMFTGSSLKEDSDKSITQIKDNELFYYRVKKLHKMGAAPSPHSISDHLSEVLKAKATIMDTSMKAYTKSTWNNTTSKLSLNIKYRFKQQECEPIQNAINIELNIDDLIKLNDNDKCKLLIPLPDYIVGISFENIEESSVITPKISGSETVIVGQNVFQAISRNKSTMEVPFKIMRDGKNAMLSTLREEKNKEDKIFFLPSAHHFKTCIEEIEGVKTFVIRDLYETGTDKCYIHFQVGDEIMLSSDWDSYNEKGPTIKKIHDFVVVSDEYKDSKLVSFNKNGLIQEENDIFKYQCDEYSFDKTTNSNIKSKEGESVIRGKGSTLYAVIENEGDDKLIFHPMLTSTGQHFLNSMSHVIKEVGELKSGDFIKADIGGIPYFPKSAVDEVVCTIPFNNRNLTILKSGYTMWTDIILNNFKIFKRDKLTDNKLEFYSDKTRLFTQDVRNEFMVIYGDMFLSQITIPLLQKIEIESIVETPENSRKLYIDKILKNEVSHTENITKVEYERMMENIEDNTLYTFAGYNTTTPQLMIFNPEYNSFRSLYNNDLQLGKEMRIQDIEIQNISYRKYDMCYSLYNTSLKNGSAYIDLETGTYGPMRKYTYYNSPFIKSSYWCNARTVTTSLSMFPTPRILKKSTKESNSFICFKYLGPQNIFYSKLTEDNMSQMRRQVRDTTPIYVITSDNIFPKQED